MGPLATHAPDMLDALGYFDHRQQLLGPLAEMLEVGAVVTLRSLPGGARF